jgi:hypothetical protein
MPEAFLDRIFSGDNQAKERRRFFIERGGMDRLPLGKLNIETLISWCAKQSDVSVWPIVGANINLWKTKAEDKSVSLSEDAMNFLVAAPDAHSVLNAFASRLESRSGGGAEAMKARVEALRKLTKSANADIAKAAEVVVTEADKHVGALGHMEQRRDEECE